MNVKPITSFRGDNYFLSNYYISEFKWRDIVVPSGEHAFAYAKTFFAIDEKSGNWYREQIMKADAPGSAKLLGRKIKINISEWDKHKVMYMRDIVHSKFRFGDPIMVHWLSNTGSGMLVEGNDWNDKFWGRVKENGKWVGLNVLGVLLMEERGWWSRGDHND